jgi:hypothetical protein
MSPEQARGEKIDGRADLFSLGCVLYLMLTGQRPFKGNDTLSLLMALAIETPKLPASLNPDVPAGVSALTMRLLAKDAAERPESAQAVVDAIADLEAAAGSPAPSARTVSRQENDTVVLPAEKRQEATAAPRRQATSIGRIGTAAVLLAVCAGGGSWLYQIVIIRDRNGTKISETRVPKDGSVEIVPEGKGADKPPAPLGQASADKENPFVLVKAKTGEKIECGTLARALKVHQDGDIIDFHGNGPFQVPRQQFKNKALTLRAAPGYRPVLVAVAVERDHLQCDNVELRVEGIDFRAHVGLNFAWFGGTGRSWGFARCRWLQNEGTGIAYHGPRVQLEDCFMFLGQGGWLRSDSTKLDLDVKNCVIWTHCHSSSGLFHPRKDACWTVSLKDNTILMNTSFFPDGSRIEPNTILEVEAHRNVFSVAWPRDLNPWKDHFRWKGSYNLYVDPGTSLRWKLDKEGKMEYGLAAWEALTDTREKGEKGSREAKEFYPAWAALDLADKVDRQIDVLRPLTAELRKTHAPALANVGPDWDLVGPGPGYLRARAAQGKPVPPEQMRPKTLEGAPFLIVRAGKPLKGYDDIDLAFNATDDGDVIEIRTDGPVTSRGLEPLAKPRSVTVRAGAGYTPVVRDRAAWLMPNLTLSVEGLHFAQVSLADGHSNKQGAPRLARVANCSFSGPFGAGRDNIDGGSTTLQLPGKAPCEIVNCVIPAHLLVYFEPGSHLLVRNSIVGPISTRWKPSAGADHIVELERSFLFHPGGYGYWSPTTIRGWGEAGDPPFTQPRFKVRDTIFESSLLLFDLGNKDVKIASWTGERNCYRVGVQNWYSVHGGQTPPVQNLGDWQRLWKSDADSVQVEPTVYDPRQWRLLPGSPGYQQGPDGRDLGADVERVARR